MSMERRAVKAMGENKGNGTLRREVDFERLELTKYVSLDRLHIVSGGMSG